MARIGTAHESGGGCAVPYPCSKAVLGPQATGVYRGVPLADRRFKGDRAGGSSFLT